MPCVDEPLVEYAIVLPSVSLSVLIGEAVGTYAAQSSGEEGGTFQLKCGDSPEQVAAFYEREMKGAGMKVEKHSMQADNRSVITVVGNDEGRQRVVTASVSSTGEGTVVMTIYQTKR